MFRCMNFGEVTIQTSRTVCDDFEENSEEDDFATLPLCWSNNVNQVQRESKCSILLVIESNKVKDCFRDYFLPNFSEVCSANSHVFLLGNGEKKIVLVEKNHSLSGDVVDLILPLLKTAKQIVTLTISSKFDYRTDNAMEENNENCFIRKIKTNNNNFLELEFPNFVSGAAAGISSLSYSYHLPLESYVAYIDIYKSNLHHCQPIVELLKKLGFQCSPNYVPKFSCESNLYT